MSGNSPGDATDGETETVTAHGSSHGSGRGPAEIPPPPGKGPFLVAGLIAVGLLGWGGYGHWQKAAAAQETQRKARDFVPKLRTIAVERADQPIDITLPGQTDAFARASLFARATGYIAERRVDIGTRVKQGDILIRIAAPDLDQQLAHLQSAVSKLANRLQRRLMAQQSRSWDFDQEEGILDAARLARVVVNPGQSLSYKIERDTDFRDTVVTLLIDNSGSMRGRPITVAATCPICGRLSHMFEPRLSAE